jgi:dipeptidyl aminopeptidase/acylaminoacyl peptidase
MKTRLLALASLCLGCLFAAGAPVAAESIDPYPLDYWALRPVINAAQVSPDGKYLGIMKIPAKDANPVIEVYEAANLDKDNPIFTLNADPMEITNFFWASDNDIIFYLRQKVRNKIEGFNRGVYETKLAVVDVESKEMEAFDETNPLIENLLESEPDKIIISFQEGGDDGPGSKLSEAFRPRAYWEFDLNRGTKELLVRGTISRGQVEFDGNGNSWLARGYDDVDNELVWYWRKPGSDKGWREFRRQDFDKLETFEVLELDDTQPDHILVRADNGDDKLGLWSYNVNTDNFDELIYRRSDVDVYGVRYHSNTWTYPDRVTGVSYFKDKLHVEYFDEVEGAVYGQLAEIIPNSYNISIPSRSRDGNTMTVLNTGPRDPGTYYLLKEGKIQAAGSRQPLLESEKLADMKYITYKSRDGLTIPAFLTVPNGEPPFPLIVLPHGGPFVQETVIYDEWAQMLANNGYLVLQPQYRGSQGYGEEFYKIAFTEGGQGGYKMQDDKDDGALFLRLVLRWLCCAGCRVTNTTDLPMRHRGSGRVGPDHAGQLLSIRDRGLAGDRADSNVG